jgi:pimeloyl-ACP methyl ester carboxylesterase
VAENTTAPKWVVQSTPPSKAALVFVHGIFGDTIGTWTNSNGTSFFELIRSDPKLAGNVDIFAFGFMSNMIQAGSLDIQEAANKLHEHLKYHGVNDYPAVVFVAHSMGGLVVLRTLLTHREIIERVPVMVFYATPQYGSEITAIATHVANNPALEQMLPADGNGSLRSMIDEWKSLAKRPPIRCAYEKKTTGGVNVVPWTSATPLCEGAPAAISEDHLGIVKPDGAGHDSVVLLANALNDFVVGKQLAAKLDTPDFIKAGNVVTFTLSGPLGKHSARLVNLGKTKLRYTLADFSDPSLYVWPADTPQDLPGGTTAELKFGLAFGADPGKDYRFVLKSDVSPDQTVVVKVANPEAYGMQQVKIAQDVSANIKALLSDPKETAKWSIASAKSLEAQEAIVQVARETVNANNPNLPEVGQWVLAAEVMNAINWPNLAILALERAERASPGSVKADSVQRLAALTAAHAGRTQIFTTTKTPSIPETELVQKHAHPLAAPSAATASMELANQLQQFAPLKPFGLSLKGDIQFAQGDIAGASKTYAESAAILSSPSIAPRLPSTIDEKVNNDLNRGREPGSGTGLKGNLITRPKDTRDGLVSRRRP